MPELDGFQVLERLHTFPYIIFCTAYDQSYLINQTLNQLETELAENDFVRIHRSALINLNHLEEMFSWFGGSFRVRMKDKAKTELPLSRAARQKLGWS